MGFYIKSNMLIAVITITLVIKMSSAGSFDRHAIDECGNHRSNSSAPDGVIAIKCFNTKPPACDDGIHLCPNVVRKHYLNAYFIGKDEYRIYSDSFIHSVFLLHLTPFPSWERIRKNQLTIDFSFRVHDY